MYFLSLRDHPCFVFCHFLTRVERRHFLFQRNSLCAGFQLLNIRTFLYTGSFFTGVSLRAYFSGLVVAPLFLAKSLDDAFSFLRVRLSLSSGYQRAHAPHLRGPSNDRAIGPPRYLPRTDFQMKVVEKVPPSLGLRLQFCWNLLSHGVLP